MEVHPCPNKLVNCQDGFESLHVEPDLDERPVERFQVEDQPDPPILLVNLEVTAVETLLYLVQGTDSIAHFSNKLSTSAHNSGVWEETPKAAADMSARQLAMN